VTIERPEDPRPSPVLTRRGALGLVGASTLLAGGLLGQGAPGGRPAPAAAAMPGPYVLPPLPYASDALDGFLSAEILELHHGKHHAGYVKGLNATLDAMAEARRGGDMAQIKELERALAFHGSGHVLHSLYWLSMSPDGGKPTGALAAAIEACFGGLAGFRGQFAAASKAAEASGWGILAWEPLGDRLVITAAESHQQMGLVGSVPLIACDVWEHAYYLRYANKRGDYVDGFLEVIDWRGAAERYERARRLLATTPR